MGYTGRFCESIQDFCEGGLSPPCHPLVTCTNKPTGPECGGCPTGYEGNGLFCLGKKLNWLVVETWVLLVIKKWTTVKIFKNSCAFYVSGVRFGRWWKRIAMAKWCKSKIWSPKLAAFKMHWVCLLYFAFSLFLMKHNFDVFFNVWY